MASFLSNILRNPTSISASGSSNGSVPVPVSSSNQASKGGPVVIELHLNQIRRPLMRTRTNDQQKVQQLMDSISQIGLQVPVRQPSPNQNLLLIKVDYLQQQCSLTP